jgi:hypothetical protein
LSLFIELVAILQAFCYIGKLRSFVLVFLFDLESIQYDPEEPRSHAQLKKIVLAHDEVHRDKDY